MPLYDTTLSVLWIVIATVSITTNMHLCCMIETIDYYVGVAYIIGLGPRLIIDTPL